MAGDDGSRTEDPAAAYADAEASIRRAEEQLAAMFGGGAATPPPGRTAASRRPRQERVEAASGAGAPDAVPVAAPRRSTRTRRRLGGIAITLAFVPIGLIASAALAGGDAKGPDPAAALKSVIAPKAPETTPVFDPRDVRSDPGRHVSVVARVPAGAVRVRRRPHTRTGARTLRATRLSGRRLPLVLLVKQRRAGWLQVYLPSRPNLSKGWIRRSAVKLRANPYRVKIELTKHRITAWRANRPIVRARIGVGKSLTPTPTGQYFITDLLRPPDPGGTYGPYAFGLSGHSPVLTSFAGGDGQLGLHGTDQPGALGSDVSHGCIRVRNSVIRKLARTLPLGTPLAIRR